MLTHKHHKGFYKDLSMHKNQGYSFVKEAHGGLVKNVKLRKKYR